MNPSFRPPYVDPQTEEEFEACHRAYWNFIADHELWFRPRILSAGNILLHRCYGCAFMSWKAGSNDEAAIKCPECPLVHACRRYLEIFYNAPTKEFRASTAREIANAWKFTTET